MNKLLIVCGPTATGKTELAVKIAKKYNGEIISADSRQIYEGMDIGTGKDTDKIYNLKSRINDYNIGYHLKNNIPIWLLDIINPSQNFSAVEYQKLAWMVANDIRKRKKIPILVGGTGLYIKAVIDGIETSGIPQNWKLRKELENLPISELQKILEKNNPSKCNSMNNSDKNNPRRLIRAIEISKYLKKKKNFVNKNLKTVEAMDSLIIGLSLSNKKLYQKIDTRVENRVKEGIINEIKPLIKKGYSWSLPSFSGLGYKEWQNYLENNKTLEETVQIWKYDEHSYARRQMTWFKKDKRIIWFNIENKNFTKDIFTSVEKWLKKT